MSKDRFLLYYGFDNGDNYEQLRMYPGKSLKVCLGIGNMFVNDNLKYMKDKVIKEISLENPTELTKNG